MTRHAANKHAKDTSCVASFHIKVVPSEICHFSSRGTHWVSINSYMKAQLVTSIQREEGGVDNNKGKPKDETSGVRLAPVLFAKILSHTFPKIKQTQHRLILKALFPFPTTRRAERTSCLPGALCVSRFRSDRRRFSAFTASATAFASRVGSGFSSLLRLADRGRPTRRRGESESERPRSHCSTSRFACKFVCKAFDCNVFHIICVQVLRGATPPVRI